MSLKVFVAVGSNLDREHHIICAIAELEKTFGCLTCSSVYESEAHGFDGPPFYNLVVGFNTDLNVDALIDFLKSIEFQYGKPDNASPFTSRTLDLDLLLYNNLTLFNHMVELPHGDILKYPFVLKPLAEIASKKLHPLLGKTFEELWEVFDKGFIEISKVQLKLKR